MPGYSGALFEHCVLPLLHVQCHVTVGWGMEALFARSAEAYLRRPPRIFVLDETPAVHTRPVGGGMSAYGLGGDEGFLNPVAYGLIIRELGRFRSREEAASFAFPPTDEGLNWTAIDRHMARARGARRVFEMGQEKSAKGYARKALRKLVARLYA